jgi:hypothetical protein
MLTNAATIETSVSRVAMFTRITPRFVAGNVEVAGKWLIAFACITSATAGAFLGYLFFAFARRRQPSMLPIPNPGDLIKAHDLYQKNEPRWRDYWRAVEDVENGFRNENFSAAAGAIATLLRSWHRDYYHWRPARAAVLQPELEQLIIANLNAIQALSDRSIATLTEADRATVLTLFSSFEQKLDQVGAAKALNLIAPKFFPLWDSAISYGYGVVGAPQGYFLFMVVVKDQVGRIEFPDGLDALKTLDEYNYCKYTKNWVS